MDNETSDPVEKILRGKGIEIQYVPPHNHRANRAERAIRDVKNHIIATLGSTDPSFPLYLWDEVLPQLNITINLLRPFQDNTKISAYAGIHGHQFDFISHPLAPTGTKVLIHETPQVRQSWAAHGIKGYYIGPALKHYRSYSLFYSTSINSSDRHSSLVSNIIPNAWV
jgi:hypothetical protein